MTQTMPDACASLAAVARPKARALQTVTPRRHGGNFAPTQYPTKYPATVTKAPA